ncbi:MAG: DUF559 domain-containing protein [Solirubrobacterales bacterium]|nr:DUF559 domain-containing protein [Solirubrobacterales bacterium]
MANWQLKVVGFTSNQIKVRLQGGRLHRLHRGVYAVGHLRLTREASCMAAVLACGPDAVLSHATAVALWGLRPWRGGRIDVTMPGRTRRGPKNIRAHHVRTLHPEDRAQLDGIPITSIHRTLLDYAELGRRQQLRLAIEAADRKDLFDLKRIEEVCSRSRGRRGLKPLKAVLAEIRGPTPWTRSELERRALALLREGGVREPQVNVLVAGELVDLYWPGTPPLVVELDGWEFHKSRQQFEQDRRRDAKLQVLGCRVLRITQWRLEHEPTELLSDLIRLLPAEAPAMRSAT